MSEEPEDYKPAETTPLPAKTAGIDVQLAVGERGLMPTNAAEMFRLATFIAQSKLAPKGMTEPAQIMIAMQIGLELGITPMRAVSSISVINGKPSLSGTLALGLLRSKGIRHEHLRHGVEFDDDYAEGIKTAAGETWFSVAEAKRSGLWKKEGPWTQYPSRMLFWRSVGHHCSEYYSAELMGIPISEAADFVGIRQQLTPTREGAVEPTGPDPLFEELPAKQDESE